MTTPVIVFDGVCNICSGWVQFVLKRDADELFHFASMQGQAGRQLLAQAGLNADDPDSFVLAEGAALHRETDALIRILKKLKQPWPLVARVIAIIPRGLRDWAYYRIARNRYRLFGKKESCMIPRPEVRARFLD